MSHARQLVEQAISSNRVMVFSKSYCPHCRRAKALLQKYLQKLGVLELDEIPEGPEMQRVLGELTGGTSVPRVSVHGKSIGGASEVQKLEDSGQLQALLAGPTPA